MRAPTALRQARPSGIDRLPPLTARLRRPLLLSATAVVGTLVVLGGWAAVIVGFFALVLVLERASRTTTPRCCVPTSASDAWPASAAARGSEGG